MQDTATVESATLAGGAMRPLRQGVARAALASGAAEVATRVLTIVLSIATARALEPREVGILGIAVIVTGVISMLGFYPETAGVAARGNGTDAQYALASTAIRGGLIALLLISLFLAVPVLTRTLTGNDEGVSGLGKLLPILIWVPIFELVSCYPQVLLQRRLDLNYVAIAQLLQPFVFVGLAVFLLVSGRGYIGIAWASVTGAVVMSLLLWVRLFVRGLIKWHGGPSRAVWRETLRGSGRVFAGGFGGYLGTRLDNLLVAGSLGPTAMSFYSMAWNAARMPSGVFARSISLVLVPSFARIQDDPTRMHRALRECLRHSYLILTPVCAVLFVSAPALVSLVVGPKWLPLVPAMRVMCVTSLAGPALFVSSALLTGTGRAHLMAISTIAHLAALVLIMPVFAHKWGVIGAAYADLLAVSILTGILCATARLVAREIGRAVTSSILVPVVAAAFASLLAWQVSNWVTTSYQLICEVAIVLLCYPVFISLLGGAGRLMDLTGLLRTIGRRAEGVAARDNV